MLATDDSVEDDQDFVAVTHKSSKNMMKQSTRKNKGKGRWQPPIEKPLSDLFKQKMDLLRGSSFLRACQAMLREDLSSERRTKCKKCLCFGLGSLRNSPKSLFQLALLQLLLESDFAAELPSKPVSMDPEFSPEDVEFIQSLGHDVVDYQDEILDLKEDTFLYMPHCPRWLYEKLLDTNQPHLNRMVLLSNDLSLYAEREIRAEELKKIPKLQELGKFFQVFTLPEYDERPDAFNDMAWQWTASIDKNRPQNTGNHDKGSRDVDALAASVSSLSVAATITKDEE